MSLLGGVASARKVGLVCVAALAFGYACSKPERDYGSNEQPDGQGGEAGHASNVAGSGSSDGSSGAKGSGGASSSPCGDATCLHGGQCATAGDTLSCDCAGTGYDGETCDQNIDECESSPCKNGGVCEDTPGDYDCDCSAAPEYAGKNCDRLRFEPLPVAFRPQDISPDGSVVVGSNADRATKYVGGKEVGLGVYLGDMNSIAFGASEGGQVIVGASGTGYPLTDTSRAVRWKGSSITELDMPDGYTRCEASDVTPDGSVIVGTCDGSIVRWVDGTLEELGKASDVSSCEMAVVSDDGQTIAGRCSLYPNIRAFVWTKAEGFSLLVPLVNTSNCTIVSLSADGAKAAGTCSSGGSYAVPLFWTAADGPTELAGVETASVSEGKAITASGSRVVGYSSGTAGLWDDPAGEMQPLRDLLPASTPELSTWQLTDAVSVSADGKTIVGTGSVDSASRPYILRLD